MKQDLIAKLHTNFETIVRREADSGTEFWWARELQELLGYAKREGFAKVIEKAKTPCQNSWSCAFQPTAKRLHNTAQGRAAHPGSRPPRCRPTLKGLHHGPIRHIEPCGTPLGFGIHHGTVTQGGAAAPLTLGFVVERLRRTSHTRCPRCRTIFLTSGKWYKSGG